MDRLSIAGLVVAIFAIYIGFMLDGGAVSALFELPAFIIVVGGTLGAVMLQSSSVQFLHALSLFWDDLFHQHSHQLTTLHRAFLPGVIHYIECQYHHGLLHQ